MPGNGSNTEAAPADPGDTECGYDGGPPDSSVVPITPYWTNSASVSVEATVFDVSVITNVSLWYRFSADNGSWGDWTFFEKDTTSAEWSWNFDFPMGVGYYQFYSRANDSLGYYEAAPAENDSNCGYDTAPPVCSANEISNYWQSSQVLITGTAKQSKAAEKWLDDNDAAVNAASQRLEEYSQTKCGLSFISGEA